MLNRKGVFFGGLGLGFESVMVKGEKEIGEYREKYIGMEVFKAVQMGKSMHCPAYVGFFSSPGECHSTTEVVSQKRRAKDGK